MVAADLLEHLRGKVRSHAALHQAEALDEDLLQRPDLHTGARWKGDVTETLLGIFLEASGTGQCYTLQALCLGSKTHPVTRKTKSAR